MANPTTTIRATSPLITVRALDPVSGEPLYGQGQANFLTDAEAVTQIVSTRLKLFQGEWWTDQNDGLPLWQQILGAGADRTVQAISLLIQQRILGAPFVTGIESVSATYDPNPRAFTFNAVVNTQFGTITVSTIPTPPPQGFPQ